MNHQYDTVIIGAGPAGMGCATTLQKKKQQVCVIDKAVFPRNKTCAGLVTSKTHRLIESLFDGEDVSGLFCCTASTVKLYRKTQLLARAPIQNSANLVNRIDFDNALVERYKALGGLIMEGERITRVDYANNCVVLSNGDMIGYRHIIFADGALSLSHRQLKVDKRKLAFGIEAYVPSAQFSTDSVDLYFDCIDNGYLWVFPHGETVCIGVAGMYDKNVDYKKIISDFLISVGVDPKIQQYTGAFLPYGYVIPQEKLPQNVMLVGDAGGFTDPISGEGLYMALKTGMLAAASLSSATPKRTYLESLKPIVSIVSDGYSVQRIFFSSAVQKLFLNKAKGKNELVSYFYDNMVDDYNYDYRHIRKLYSDYKSRDAKQ